MLIKNDNGVPRAYTNRVERLKFLEAMRTVVEFSTDFDNAIKNGFKPVVEFDKYCPSADEIERLKSLPPDDYPDGFDTNFDGSVLWFNEIMFICGKVSRKRVINDIIKRDWK